jgi:hypothetical protein
VAYGEWVREFGYGEYWGVFGERQGLATMNEQLIENK